jgi:hypothetical protein
MHRCASRVATVRWPGRPRQWFSRNQGHSTSTEPGAVHFKIGAQHLVGCLPVPLGVDGDALQRVDPAQPHINAAVAELVDGGGESLSELALAGDLDLPPGEVGADQQRRTAEALQQGGADIVDRFGPVGWRRAAIEVPGKEVFGQQHHAEDDDYRDRDRDRSDEPPGVRRRDVDRGRARVDPHRMPWQRLVLLGGRIHDRFASSLLVLRQDSRYRRRTMAGQTGRRRFLPGCFERSSGSASGKALATSAGDGTVRLWEAPSLRQIGLALPGPERWSVLGFDPGGNRLAALYDNGTALVWDVDPEHWKKRACAVVGRPLTREEWVGLGQGGDLLFQPADRGGQGIQEPTAVLDDLPWGRWSFQAGQPGPPRTSPQASRPRQLSDGLYGLEPRTGRGPNELSDSDYSAAARAALTMPAPKKELRLALP